MWLCCFVHDVTCFSFYLACLWQLAWSNWDVLFPTSAVGLNVSFIKVCKAKNNVGEVLLFVSTCLSRKSCHCGPEHLFCFISGKLLIYEYRDVMVFVLVFLFIIMHICIQKWNENFRYVIGH